MYEVFLNDRRLVIASVNEQPSPGLKIDFCDDASHLQTLVSDFLNGEDEHTFILGDENQLWNSFKAMFTPVPAAGGVVHGENGYLFIFRRGKWDLPKGKIEQGEIPEEAALREVTEETGLTGLTLTGPLPSTWHVYKFQSPKSKEIWILKETKWFSMQSTTHEIPVPQTEEEIEIIRWIQKDDLNDILSNTFRSLRKLISNISF